MYLEQVLEKLRYRYFVVVTKMVFNVREYSVTQQCTAITPRLILLITKQLELSGLYLLSGTRSLVYKSTKKINENTGAVS